MLLKTIEAVFDGKVFRPTEPIGLESNTRVRITIESIEIEEGEPYSFLDAAMAANLDGPEDWSTNLDKYLYGDADEK
ncbi:MAG: antitoxin family protein [Chloroflexi bacterium]|nr:antitoxin family protein [Chloroflexota bacterium]